MTDKSIGPTWVVLVVEDDPIVRINAVDIVEDTLSKTYEAANADEAIELLEAYPEINVLFTDIDMPGSMDGLKLAHAVRQRWPHMVIIIASGHVRVSKNELPEDGVFFPKPYTATVIKQALQTFAGPTH